ncbi:hypothetical protein BH18ACT10_BH18ACT10_03960 [soil metagenome]
MSKSIFSKVMWVGRATVFTVGLAVTLALMLGVATAALAAVPGDPFRLGELNKIDQLSQLVGDVDGAMLEIINESSGLNATALDLQVNAKRPPMKVNSGTRVSNLNADRLDNKTAADFYYNSETVADSEKLDGIDSIEFFTQRTNTYRVYVSVRGPGGGGTRTSVASCDPGDKVLSGGGRVQQEGDDLLGTYPSGASSQSWTAWFQDNGSPHPVHVFATCVDFQPFRP